MLEDIVNQMGRRGYVKESGRKGRELLHARVD